MYKPERIPRYILNKVETSHLLSFRLYFIFTILITENVKMITILAQLLGEVSGI